MCSLKKRVFQKLYLFVITVFNAYFVVRCSTCNLLVGQFISAFNCDVPELQYVLFFSTHNTICNSNVYFVGCWI